MYYLILAGCRPDCPAEGQIFAAFVIILALFLRL
jgi:hypothetical protein